MIAQKIELPQREPENIDHIFGHQCMMENAVTEFEIWSSEFDYLWQEDSYIERGLRAEQERFLKRLRRYAQIINTDIDDEPDNDRDFSD